MNPRTARIIGVIDRHYRTYFNKNEGDYCLSCSGSILDLNKDHLLYAVLFQNGITQKEYLVAVRKAGIGPEHGHMRMWDNFLGKHVRIATPHLGMCLQRNRLVEILELIPYEEEVPPSEP